MNTHILSTAGLIPCQTSDRGLSGIMLPFTEQLSLKSLIEWPIDLDQLAIPDAASLSVKRCQTIWHRQRQFKRYNKQTTFS